MAEEHAAVPQPSSMSILGKPHQSRPPQKVIIIEKKMPEVSQPFSKSILGKPLQSRPPQKLIIIKSSPALDVSGVKRKLDCSSGNPEKVQKPSDILVTPCSSYSSASQATETPAKNIILYNRGSKPLICTLPKSTMSQNRKPVTVITHPVLQNRKPVTVITRPVLQNRKPVTVITRPTGPALPKITFERKNTQLTKESVVGKTLSNETLAQLGVRDPGRTKTVGKGFVILRGKKVEAISSKNLLKPVTLTLGQLTNTPQVQVSHSSPVSYPFISKDSSKLSLPQSTPNADSTVTTACSFASRNSTLLQDQRKLLEQTSDLSDVKAIVDNTSQRIQKRYNKDVIYGIPTFRQYYAIHCPFHGDFNTYTKYLVDERSSTERDETNGGQQEPCAVNTPSWSGSCPICCLYCVSVCDSTDDLFNHMDVHKPWLQFVDVACHLCPLEKHLPTMEKLEFQGWCNWRTLRLSMLGDHLRVHHDVDPSYESNPHEQVYDLLIDPAKVRPTNSNSVRFDCPMEFARHMMRHFHVLGCRLVCSLCLRRNNGFGDVQGEGENDLGRLEQHYRTFHPTDLESIPIVFQLRVRPGRVKKPNRIEITSKYQTLLSSIKSCFKPNPEWQNEIELDERTDMKNTIPMIQCPFSSSGCEFRTLNVGHLTEHVDWHMASVPLRWRVSCYRCCSVFDNFLDAMLHFSQTTVTCSVIVKVLASYGDRPNEVGRMEKIEDCFSKPLTDVIAPNSHSISSDVLAQTYVDNFRNPGVDSPQVDCHDVLSIAQMGLFLVVQPPVTSNTYSSKWDAIGHDDTSNLAERKWQRLISEVQLKKSVTSPSSPALKFSYIPRTSSVNDTSTVQNTSKTNATVGKSKELSSALQTLTLPSSTFNPLQGPKSASSNVQQVKFHVNVNNNMQPRLQIMTKRDKTAFAKSKYGSKLKAQMLNKSLLLKNKRICVEPFQPTPAPSIDTSRNLNRSTYAEIETLFIGQQYGINENVKVIIKEIDSELRYQCPYCVFSSLIIFDVANHLVQEHDNADLELNDTNSIHLKTHMLLMHCRLCDYVTHHHPSLLWHLQSVHDILDEPTTSEDDPIEISQAVALEMKRTLHFRCAHFDECAFGSIAASAVARHSYQSHTGDGDMFGIGHVACNKVSFGIHHDVSSDVKITPQFVCAHCHVATPSRKVFATHYLFEHASRLLYICMYCEAHLNSLAAIIKHIDYRHAGFERLICSVMFIGDLGEDETAVIQRKQPLDVSEAASDSCVDMSHHGLSSVYSVPCMDVKFASGIATGSSEVHRSTALLAKSHKAGTDDAGPCDSTFYANVTKIESSKSCVVSYKGRELWLPFSIVAPLLKRP